MNTSNQISRESSLLNKNPLSKDQYALETNLPNKYCYSLQNNHHLSQEHQEIIDYLTRVDVSKWTPHKLPLYGRPSAYITKLPQDNINVALGDLNKGFQKPIHFLLGFNNNGISFFISEHLELQKLYEITRQKHKDEYDQTSGKKQILEKLLP